MIRASAEYRYGSTPWAFLADVGSDGGIATGLFGFRRTQRLKVVEVASFRVESEHFASLVCAPETTPSDVSRLLVALVEDQAECRIIEFNQVDRVTANLLRVAAQRARLQYTITTASQGYYFDTRSSMDSFESKLGRKLRRNLRRERRRLSRRYTVELKVVNTGDRASNLAYLEQFMALEATGWKGRQKTDMGSIESDYYRSLVEHGSDCGAVRWFALQANGKTVSMYLCYRHGTTMWALKTAYDESFAQYSPGNELLFRILELMHADEGIRRLHMITCEPWVANWRPEAERYFRFRIFRPSVVGHLLCLAEKLMFRTAPTA